jgi:hypothetical protein
MFSVVVGRALEAVPARDTVVVPAATVVDAIEDGTDVVDDEAAVVAIGPAVEDEIVPDEPVVDAAADAEPRWVLPAHPAETMATARTATQFDKG